MEETARNRLDKATEKHTSIKGKVFLVCAMKTYRRISGRVPLLTSATGRCGWLDSCPSPFTPRAEPQYPLNRWVNESQSQSAPIGEKSLAPAWI
jgi:hypothetical protein